MYTDIFAIERAFYYFLEIVLQFVFVHTQSETMEMFFYVLNGKWRME